MYPGVLKSDKIINVRTRTIRNDETRGDGKCVCLFYNINIRVYFNNVLLLFF